MLIVYNRGCIGPKAHADARTIYRDTVSQFAESRNFVILGNSHEFHGCNIAAPISRRLSATALRLGCGGAFYSDAIQKDAGGFVAWVLGDEFAPEGLG